MEIESDNCGLSIVASSGSSSLFSLQTNGSSGVGDNIKFKVAEILNDKKDYLILYCHHCNGTP